MNVSALRLATSAPTRLPCALWRVDLDQHVPAAAHARLSAEELARAARFVFPTDRQRYVAAHAALRQLLAQHLTNAEHAVGESPCTGESLSLVVGRFGKPALAAPARLHFNLSHSHDVGLVALSEDCELGIDIERLRPMTDALAMAAAYFTPAEQAALAACEAGAERDRAFLTCWTRKEACLKALGIGLYLATSGFEVGLLPATQVVEIAVPEGIERLQLQSFADGDVLGALALRRAPSRFHHAGASLPVEVPA